MTTKPYKYQSDGALQIERFGGRALLADQMGLGKSLTSLLWAKRSPEARPVLVVCPAPLKWNWQREAAVHFGMRAEVLEGTKPHAGCLAPGHQITIINYDILGPWMPYLARLNPQLVILDEAQAITNRAAKRSRYAKALCAAAPHVIALSGTPLTNRPAELWQVINAVRPDLFPKFFPFAMRYCAPVRERWGWSFKGATNLDELHDLLRRSVMIRRLKKDVLPELPEMRHTLVPTEIDDRKQYDEAVKDFLSWLTRIDAARAARAARAERLTRLGYLKRLVGVLKARAVCAWVDNYLESGDDKLVLFAVHKEVIAHFMARYKRLAVKVDGDVVGRARQDAVDRFQKDESVRLFVGNVQAAGKGLTLTRASAVAFAEIAWTPGEMSQARDRIHRIGQKEITNSYYLAARDTIEQRLLEIISAKQKILDSTLDGKHSGGGEDEDTFDVLCSELLKKKR